MTNKISCDNYNVIPIEMSGHQMSESEGVCHTLNCHDQRKVFGANQKRTMVAIIDDTYKNRPTRIYEKQAPTLRRDREGLKVVMDIKTLATNKKGE